MAAISLYPSSGGYAIEADIDESSKIIRKITISCDAHSHIIIDHKELHLVLQISDDDSLRIVAAPDYKLVCDKGLNDEEFLIETPEEKDYNIWR